MPGWYVHMEAAKQTAQRLRDGDVPPNFPIDIASARKLGDICYRWRNYLAVGSLGPDLFYLLPDFSNTKGVVIRNVMRWVVDVWKEVDDIFFERLDHWLGPIGTNDAQLSSQLTGGLSHQLGNVLSDLAASAGRAILGLVGTMGDWFGLLTSGVPQGVKTNAFYWSDVFHYRRTYQFPYTLYRQASHALAKASNDTERADAEARLAFAIGWMSHCATDVTGHPFTNAKCGGPYRNHWQRHHLVENHFDSENYIARPRSPYYSEYGTSALHFWAAFRGGMQAPYIGRNDAPAYDYFAGLPAYDLSPGPTGSSKRRNFFSLESGAFPEHLIDALLEAMTAVHPDGPKILTQDPPFSATNPQGEPDGRPNKAAFDQMWEIVYEFLEMSASDGLGPTRPQYPHVLTDHSFPTPPGGAGYGIDDDPGRGADIEDDNFTLLDLLLAIIGCIIFIFQVIIWLVTILPGLILDVATFPARVVIYYAVEVPVWNLYLSARRALVMAGFIIPKTEEIDNGLITLGSGSGGFNLAAALDDPAGVGLTSGHFVVNEPSGRATSTSRMGLDDLYPRNIVRDRPEDVRAVDIPGTLGLTPRLIYATDDAAQIWLQDLAGESGTAAAPGTWTPQSELAHAVDAAGFRYDPTQDIIYSTMYPLQRSFGYCYAYDAAALGMNAIIDCEPIFFDYGGKSWMIELWKGQYGIETGAEIGVYTRSGTAPSYYAILDATVGKRSNDPDPSHSRFFDCAIDSDRLRMSWVLHRNGTMLFSRGSERHWWLTGFKWGLHSEPEELTMNISIECLDATMTAAFTTALASLGYSVQTTGNTVSFVFDTPRTYQPRAAVPALVAAVRAQNQQLVAAYNSLGLTSNDPNTVGSQAAATIGRAFALYSLEFFAKVVPPLFQRVEGFKPSEWIAPWKYPLVNQAGVEVPQEGAPVHVGPYVIGDRASVLIPGAPGDTGARNSLEDCRSPAATFAALNRLLVENKHLGGPVDYGVYLVGRMAHANEQGTDAQGNKGIKDFPVPDFNLDSDRGYGWHCWDWNRHGTDRAWRCVPDLETTVLGNIIKTDFSYRQPCTPPQFFDAVHDNKQQVQPGTDKPLPQQWYNPEKDLAVHYIISREPEGDPPDGVDPCESTAVTPPPLPSPVDWSGLLRPPSAIRWPGLDRPRPLIKPADTEENPQ